eukprot:15040131-Heterocapsa_arctica.AAC.1
MTDRDNPSRARARRIVSASPWRRARGPCPRTACVARRGSSAAQPRYASRVAGLRSASRHGLLRVSETIVRLA